MAGILGIYGLIVSVIIIQKIKDDMSYSAAYSCMCAGLSCGISCMASGYAIGICGDMAVRMNARQDLYIG